MNKKSAILITGATGLVGSYVARQLWANGYENLHAIRRPECSLNLVQSVADHIHWQEADLKDVFSLEDAMEGINVIIHCAAVVSFKKKDRDHLYQSNVQGTANLVNAAMFKNVPRIIHVSSVAALGRSPQKGITHENSKWEKSPELSNYSITKFLSEQEIWRGQAEGLEVNVVYPSVVFGGGLWQKGSTQLMAYADAAPAFYASGSTGIVDVRDVAKAIQLVLEKATNGQRFLLNGTNVSYQSFLQQLCDKIEQPAPRRLLPQQLAGLLAFLDKLRCWVTGGKPFLTKETVHTAYQNYQYDSSKSEKELGLKYISLEETIAETAQLYMETKTKGWGVLDLK